VDAQQAVANAPTVSFGVLFHVAHAHAPACGRRSGSVRYPIKREVPFSQREAPFFKREVPFSQREAHFFQKEFPFSQREVPFFKRGVPFSEKGVPFSHKEPPPACAAGFIERCMGLEKVRMI
jgi:hypothetical protein